MLTGPGLKSVRARYEMTPSVAGDLILDVVEEYRLVEEGKALVGSLTSFSRDPRLLRAERRRLAAAIIKLQKKVEKGRRTRG